MITIRYSQKVRYGSKNVQRGLALLNKGQQVHQQSQRLRHLQQAHAKYYNASAQYQLDYGTAQAKRRIINAHWVIFKAAQQGHVQAQYATGQAYAKGLMSPKNVQLRYIGINKLHSKAMLLRKKRLRSTSKKKRLNINHG